MQREWLCSGTSSHTGLCQAAAESSLKAPGTLGQGQLITLTVSCQNFLGPTVLCLCLLYTCLKAVGALKFLRGLPCIPSVSPECPEASKAEPETAVLTDASVGCFC